jgi:hypothetical protein
MKNNEELNRNFYQILEESDRKHAEHTRRLAAKKQKLFDLLSGKKPTENDDNNK